MIDSLLKEQCGTIHGVGSFRGLGRALVLYQISTKEPNYKLSYRWGEAQPPRAGHSLPIHLRNS